jgi:NADPH-dependent curcumin reductase CurA
MAATASTTNREWVFLKRPGPSGFEESDFALRPCEVPTVGDGELLLATHLVSIDPTMRNAMGGSEVAERTSGSGYYAFMNWQPGAVITWSILARVVEARAPGFAEGDIVTTFAPLKELTKADAAHCQKVPTDVPLTAAMSVMGMTSRTAYCSAKYIGEPKAGDVAFVSGAAGAVGLVACQTLQNLGCRVIGSAGSDDKVALLESIGVEAFNYKKEATLQGLRRLGPDGLNIFFDNVGGEVLEASLEMMNDFGRVVMCGAISQYDKPPAERYGVKNLFHVVAKQLKLQGFIVSSFTPEQLEECDATMADWLRSGKLKDWHTAVDGFERFPDGIRGLFTGQNTGKMLVRVPLPTGKL